MFSRIATFIRGFFGNPAPADAGPGPGPGAPIPLEEMNGRHANDNPTASQRRRVQMRNQFGGVVVALMSFVLLVAIMGWVACMIAYERKFACHCADPSITAFEVTAADDYYHPIVPRDVSTIYVTETTIIVVTQLPVLPILVVTTPDFHGFTNYGVYCRTDIPTVPRSSTTIFKPHDRLTSAGTILPIELPTLPLSIPKETFKTGSNYSTSMFYCQRPGSEIWTPCREPTANNAGVSAALATLPKCVFKTLSKISQSASTFKNAVWAMILSAMPANAQLFPITIECMGVRIVLWSDEDAAKVAEQEEEVPGEVHNFMFFAAVLWASVITSL